MDETKSWPSWSDFARAADELSGSWAVQKGPAVGPSVVPKLTRLRKSSAVGKSEVLTAPLKSSLPTITSPFVLSNVELFRAYLEQEEKLQRAQARRAAMQGFEADEMMVQTGRSERFALPYGVRHASAIKAGDRVIVGGQLVTITAVGGQDEGWEEFPSTYDWSATQFFPEEDAAPAPRDEIKPELLKKRVSEW